MSWHQIPVFISDRAREEVVAIFTNKNIPNDFGLRIGVKGGGCAGITYVIGFDKPKPNDDLFETGTFQVLIEKKHLMHLLGLHVDFVESETERGFLFTHPEAD